jgi:signal transduction histidine kinase
MILNISRIESGNLLVKPEEVEVAQEAQYVMDELKTLTIKKKQKIKLNVEKGIQQIQTDRRLLKEIISNLVSNAIKYTHVGGLIEINISKVDKYVVTEVKDNGIGIPGKAQKRIFQRFFRAINAIRTENVGTGLGLAIIKNLVEMLGGKIWFKSKENRGTSFFFRLPLSGAKERKGGKSLA